MLVQRRLGARRALGPGASRSSEADGVWQEQVVKSVLLEPNVWQPERVIDHLLNEHVPFLEDHVVKVP